MVLSGQACIRVCVCGGGGWGVIPGQDLGVPLWTGPGPAAPLPTPGRKRLCICYTAGGTPLAVKQEDYIFEKL